MAPKAKDDVLKGQDGERRMLYANDDCTCVGSGRLYTAVHEKGQCWIAYMHCWCTDEHTQMNRPFGAVDVCANLKGAVPKAATQKILAALAERGEITQKAYGTSICF